MANKNLNLTQQFEESLSYVFYCFSNKSGWMEWFSHKSYGYVKKNAVMGVYFEPEGNAAFYFTAVVPEKRIAFDFIDLESKQVSQVEVSFEEIDGFVTVSLQHSGISEARYDHIKAAWETGFENLKAVLETGKDPRMWNRPFLGVFVKDWVTPELAEEENLPVDYGMQLDSVMFDYGAEAAGLQKGDIIVSLAGQDLNKYKILRDMLATMKAGDIVPLSFYRGEEKNDVEIELSPYPVYDPPNTAQDYAEKIEEISQRALKKVERILADYNDAQVSLRSAAGEWSAKETLAHLIAYENDVQTWVSTLVGGCEQSPCHSSHTVRIKGLMALYPTVDKLMAELTRRQKETIALLLELPAEFVGRRGSFTRMASELIIDLKKHYKQHLLQIEESLKNAEDVRAN